MDYPWYMMVTKKVKSLATPMMYHGWSMVYPILGRDMMGDMSFIDLIGVRFGSWNEVDEYFRCQIDEIYILMSKFRF